MSSPPSLVFPDSCWQISDLGPFEDVKYWGLVFGEDLRVFLDVFLSFLAGFVVKFIPFRAEVKVIPVWVVWVVEFGGVDVLVVVGSVDSVFKWPAGLGCDPDFGVVGIWEVLEQFD